MQTNQRVRTALSNRESGVALLWQSGGLVPACAQYRLRNDLRDWVAMIDLQPLAAWDFEPAGIETELV